MGDDALMLLVRFVSLAIAAVAIQQIAETHSMADLQDFVTSSYIDVLDWGVEKLAGALPGSEKQALPSYESLQKQTGVDDNDSNGTFKNVTEAMADISEDENDEPDSPS